MNKRAGIILYIVITLLLLSGLVIYFLMNKISYDNICRDNGYERAVAWNGEPREIFVMFGQPDRTFVDCIKDETYKKIYLDESEESITTH